MGQRRAPAVSLSDPHGFAALTAEHLHWMRERNYSDHTVDHRARSLRLFASWCAERDITRPSEVTKPIVERYQRWLFHYRKLNGEPLTFGSQYLRLSDVRGLFKWLSRENRILWNPAADLTLPRTEFRLPKSILTAEEVEVVFAQVALDSPLGIRDRTMLETLYSTGMRRSELTHLDLYDVDRKRKVVLIRQGKGHRDRVVPIGERALAWIDRYLREARPELVVLGGERALFVSNHGTTMKPSWLGVLVRDYVDRAKLGKTGSCHLFRHTMATLMLENGADLRFIQAILGHAKVTTTEIYTQVGIRKLQEIHAATHPGAKLEPSSSAAATGYTDGDDVSG